jgi:hypothetical protein
MAQQYEMAHILIHICDSIALRNKVRDPPLICESSPLQVYSLAWTYGLRQEVIQAAHLNDCNSGTRRQA